LRAGGHRPQRFEVDYLIRWVQAQIDRGAAVLPSLALDEYHAALKAQRGKAATK